MPRERACVGRARQASGRQEEQSGETGGRGVGGVVGRRKEEEALAVAGRSHSGR